MVEGLPGPETLLVLNFQNLFSPLALIASREYATINQVIAERDISRRQLYYLRERGQIAFYKLGRKNYIRLNDLDAILIQEPFRIPREKILTSFV